MSTSAAVNVLRWSALGLGVVYGFTHQASIFAKDKAEQQQREYQRKQALIQQAKAEYQKKTNPQPVSTSSQSKPDLEGPNFDIEAFLHLKE